MVLAGKVPRGGAIFVLVCDSVPPLCQREVGEVEAKGGDTGIHQSVLLSSFQP